MPTELPIPKPTNPGTEKMPEDPSDVERQKVIDGEPESDLPDPVPGLVPGTVVPGVPGVM